MLFFSIYSYANVINFKPEISISETYTDNYDQKKRDKEVEYYTRYGLGFTLEALTRKTKSSLSYFPSYVDYKKHDENDSMEHRFNLSSLYNFTRHTELNFSQSFSKTRDPQIRTGNWVDHDSIVASLGLRNIFGKRNLAGADISFSSDRFDDSDNADSNNAFKGSLSLDYWFGIRYGYSSGLSYERTIFKKSDEDKDTISGNIKLIRKLSEHFQIYCAYSQIYSDDGNSRHNVYNPSLGFNWSTSKTSKVSLGAGILFHSYNDRKDSSDFFVDADIFKIFNLSQRSSFSVSGSSGYESTSEEAASLGFNIYYKGGFNYGYRLTKKSSFNISSSYKQQIFKEKAGDRVDNTFNVNTGISWSPLRWLTTSLSYAYINFNSDLSSRDDYEENRVTLSLRLYPSRPPKVVLDKTIQEGDDEIFGNKTREKLDEQIFMNK